MKYKVLTDRFAEWNPGDIADIDDEAARVPLEAGEVVPYHGNTLTTKEVIRDTIVEEIPAKADGGEFNCEGCGRVFTTLQGKTIHSVRFCKKNE